MLVSRVQVSRKRVRVGRKRNLKKGAVFVPRRIYRSVQLLTMQYIDLVQLRKRLRRRARREKRRVLRLNKNITRDLRTIELKYMHLLPRKNNEHKEDKAANQGKDVSNASITSQAHSGIKRHKRRLRRIRKRVRRRERAVKKSIRAYARANKKNVRTMSKIKYLIRYIRERVQDTYGTDTPYATGNLLLTEYLLHKFLNLCMRDGKKQAVVKQFIKAIKYLKHEYKVHPVAIFRHVLLDNEQLFDYRIARVGRHKTIVVPSILEGEQRILRPLRMLLDTVRNARFDSDSILEDEEESSDLGGESSKRAKHAAPDVHVKKNEAIGEDADTDKNGEKLMKMPFYMHLAHTMLYYAKNKHIMQEKSLELTQIAHDNKRNIRRIVPVRTKKRGEKYSRNGLLWSWSKTRTFGGVESHYHKRALKPVPLRLGRRLQK